MKAIVYIYAFLWTVTLTALVVGFAADVGKLQAWGFVGCVFMLFATGAIALASKIAGRVG